MSFTIKPEKKVQPVEFKVTKVDPQVAADFELYCQFLDSSRGYVLEQMLRAAMRNSKFDEFKKTRAAQSAPTELKPARVPKEKNGISDGQQKAGAA